MINYIQVAPGLFVLYKNGEKISPYPLTREELDEAIQNLQLSCVEIQRINKMLDMEDGKTWKRLGPPSFEFDELHPEVLELEKGEKDETSNL